MRKSISKARQDAQSIAISLLRDIRDGAKEILDFHGIGGGRLDDNRS